MYGLQTTANRLISQQIQFESLINQGYKQEQYSGLNIFTQAKSGKFYAKIFQNKASHAISYYSYQSAERMNESVQKAKDSQDRGNQWKADKKKNDKLSKAQAEEKAANGEAPTASVQKTSFLVKKLLKEKFNIVCSVRSESYTGGSSININYSLGVDADEVKKLIGELSYGTFDGMTDCAGSRHTEPLIVDGFKLCTFRHLFVKQEMSNELRYKLAKFMSDKMRFGDIEPLEKMEDLDTKYFQSIYGSAWTWGQLFYQQFQARNFATQDESKINLLEVHYSEKDNGRIFFIYEVGGVQYNTEESPTQAGNAPKVEVERVECILKVVRDEVKPEILEFECAVI